MMDTERYEFTVRVKTAYIQEQSLPEDNRFVFALYHFDYEYR